MGPLEQVKPWSIPGAWKAVHRFLNRVWRMLIDPRGDVRLEELRCAIGEPCVDAAIAGFAPDHRQGRRGYRTACRFNTAIAAMMEFVNVVNKWDAVPQEVARVFVLLLSPFAPHLGEELWRRLGADNTLAREPWPEVVQEYLQEDSVEIAVQVNGKIRATITVAQDAGEGGGAGDGPHGGECGEAYRARRRKAGGVYPRAHRKLCGVTWLPVPHP